MRACCLTSALVTLTIVSFVIDSTYGITEKDVVAAWLFDDPGEGMVKDSSGNEHHGQILGIFEKVRGKFGRAMKLPGGGLVTTWASIKGQS